MEDPGDEGEVGGQSGDEDDRDVRDVEQLDGVDPLEALVLHRGDGYLNPHSLYVYDEEYDRDAQHERNQVRIVVGAGDDAGQRVRHGSVDEGGYEPEERGRSGLRAGEGDHLRGERVPHEGLCHSAEDEQADPAPDPPSLLDQLVEEEDDYARPHQLEEYYYRLGAWRDVWQRAAEEVGARLHGYHYEREYLRRRAEEGPVLGVTEVQLQDVAALKELEDEPCGDDWTDAERHQGPLAGCEDYPERGEGVALVAVEVERRYRHDQVAEQGQARPDELLRERGLLLRLRNLW